MIAAGSKIASACRQVNLECHLFSGRQVLVRQKDMHAKKAKAISPEMHITAPSETTDADAAAVPSQIIWSSKLLLGVIHKHHSGRDSVLPPLSSKEGIVVVCL